jgi:hypothetical protein
MLCAGFRTKSVVLRTNHLSNWFKRSVQDGHETSLGHARPWTHSVPPEISPSD